MLDKLSTALKTVRHCMTDDANVGKEMTKDGRLTIRFDELLPEIERLARQDSRKPSSWVKVQIARIVRKRRRLAEAQPAVEAPR